jgi:hypothetical protein
MKRSGTLLRAAVVVCSLASGAASASNLGIQNYSGAGGNTCAACHNVTGTPVYNMALVGPSLVAANSVNAYTFNETWVSGTKALGGGFDLETTAGTFAVNPGEKLWDANSEITHSPNQTATAGNVSWSISWTAPATGTATMTICGLARYGKANAEVMSCPSKTVKVNTAPVAVDDTLTAGKSSAATLIDVLANDTNNDSSDSLSLVSVTTPNHGGTAAIASGKINYQPASGYIGTETFDYTLHDTLGVTDVGTVTVTVVDAVVPKFSASTDYVIGGGYDAGVVATDINRAGQLDIVVTNPGAGTITVFLNNTVAYANTPSFSSGVDFNVGSGPRSIAAGDFNKDGKVDLVTANRDDDTISVLMNTLTTTTTPSFATAVAFPALSGPLAVIVKDLNNDAKPDIAVLHNDTHVRVFINDTANLAAVPSFTVQGDIDTGASPFGFTAGNFLNNARNDLAIGNGGGDQNILVYRNQTTPASAPNFTDGYTFDAFSIVRALTNGDFNGDGKLDIAAVDEGATQIAILRNTAAAHATAASFAASQRFGLDNVNDNPAALVAGDFNGDGKVDLVAASGSSHLNVLTNVTPAAASTIAMLTPIPLPVTDDFAAAVASADINGDRQPDIVTAGGFTAPNYVSVLLNQSYCTVHLAAPFQSVTEGAATADIIVKRAGVGCGAESVQISTADISAKAGSDYTAVSQTLNWAAGDTSDRTVNVHILTDSLDENDEAFNVTLSNSSADQLPTPQPDTVTIQDANSPPTVFLDKTAQIVDEAPTGQFRVVYVMLSAASGKTVTVSYTRAGSAVYNTDYTMAQGSPVTFTPGQTQKAVRFDIVNDAAHEAEENVTLNLFGPVNATLGSPIAYELKIKASD